MLQLLMDNQKLIEEIRGIRRVVINNCHGGFGLSNDAVLRYLELSSVPVWCEEQNSLIPFKYWLVPPGPNRLSDPSSDEWADMTIQERQAHNQAYSKQVFYDREVPRDDPFLVRTVLELGKMANGRCAELKVVEIPEDVDWIIEEYDGLEWIAERHRTWR